MVSSGSDTGLVQEPPPSSVDELFIEFEAEPSSSGGEIDPDTCFGGSAQADLTADQSGHQEVSSFELEAYLETLPDEVQNEFRGITGTTVVSLDEAKRMVETIQRSLGLE